MPKTCKHEGCNNHVFACNYCKFHQYLRTDKKQSTNKKQTRINRRSSKRAKQEAEYSVLRTAFLKEHPICEARLNECTRIATEVHHMKGRSGRHTCPLAA
jgi:hypothetical protein